MSTYVSYCKNLISANDSRAPGGEVISSEKVTTSGTSAQSSAAPQYCNFAIVTNDTNPMCVAVGSNPTAVDGNQYCVAGVPYVIKVNQGQKLAFIEV